MEKKYYILKRNSEEILDSYKREFSQEKLTAIVKKNKLDVSHQLILIEKTKTSLKDGQVREEYSNLWTMPEGCSILWEKYTKGKLTYDYTGVVNPLIHENGEVFTWKQYSNKSKETNTLVPLLKKCRKVLWDIKQTDVKMFDGKLIKEIEETIGK